jgi:ABC-type phosphate transport system substrate-binding protein
VAHLIKKAVFAAAVTAMVAATVTPAYADPAPGVTPAATDIVGVGSDTTQELVGALSKAYNLQVAAGAPKVYSWDATPQPDTITPKAGATSILRPDGSGAGIKALLADSKGDLDFARSSSSRGTTSPTVAFLALAQDGVTWATVPNSNAPVSLTKSQLADIYTCSPKAVYWDQVGGKKTLHIKKTTKWVWVTKTVKGKKKKVRVKKTIITKSYTRNVIQPYIPQANSGTRKFFVAALGLLPEQIGKCVKETQENTGTALPKNANVIAPYSIGKWLAQAVHKHNDQHGVYVLHQINKTAPTEGTGANVQLSASFPSQFLRLVYNVVKKVSGTETIAPKYTKVFGTAADGGYFCKHPEIIKDYGFRPIAGCGLQS